MPEPVIVENDDTDPKLDEEGTLETGNENPPAEGEPKDKEGEPKEGEEPQPEAQEFHVVLEGEEEQPTAQKRVPRRIKKLLERNNALEQEISSTKQAENDEILRLRAQLAQAQQPQQAAQPSQPVSNMPMPPTEEQAEYDPEKLATMQQSYQVAFQNWINDQHEQRLRSSTEAQEQTLAQNAETKALSAHYDRAEKLNIPNFSDNEDKAIQILGREGVRAIAMTFSKSELVVNYLGANPHVAEDIVDLSRTNPSVARERLYELNAKLKMVSRKKSNAPEPEERVSGGAVSTQASNKQLQKQFDQAAENGDIKALRKLRAIAKERGIKLTD